MSSPGRFFGQLAWTTAAGAIFSRRFIPYSVNGAFKQSLLHLFDLAYASKYQLPLLITVAFMALDVRLQIEINVFWDRPTERDRERERGQGQRAAAAAAIQQAPSPSPPTGAEDEFGVDHLELHNHSGRDWEADEVDEAAALERQEHASEMHFIDDEEDEDDEDDGPPLVVQVEFRHT